MIRYNLYFKRILLVFLFLFGSYLIYSEMLHAQVKELDWSLEIVSDGHGFTEGPAIDKEGMVYFSDMDASHILRYSPETGITEVWQGNSRCSNGLFIYNEHLYACEATGRSVVRYNLPEGPESRTILASDFQGNKLGSPNDLTIINNKLYFSEFYLRNRLQDLPDSEREIFLNRVYILSLDTHEMDTINYDFRMPNGVASSPCGKMLYIADIQGNSLYRVSLTGNSSEAVQLVIDITKHIDKAGPDGMAISEDGRIFLALFRAGMLLVLGQDGDVIGVLPTGPRTTNCVFADDKKTLYITAGGKLLQVVVPDL